jgi:hypothetical protein
MNAPLAKHDLQRLNVCADPTSLASVHRSWGTLSKAQITWLADRGVAPEVLLGPPPIGATWVRFLDGNTFDVDIDGDPADPERVRALTFCIIDGSNVTDLAAWSPRSGKIGTWRGVGYAIGQEAIFSTASYFDGDALPIHADPLLWLRSGREGIVIINTKQTYAILSHVPRVLFTDTELAEKFETWVQPPKPTVEMLVDVISEKGTA